MMEDKDIENIENNENLSDSELSSFASDDYISKSEELEITKEITNKKIEISKDDSNSSAIKEEYNEIEENNMPPKENPPQELITVRPVKFQEFDKLGIIPAIKKNLDIMQDVSMHISVEIGKTKSSIREVMELKKGSIVELNKIAGEPVEIYVNEKLVAKGEVIVMEDKFGVRVTTTNLPRLMED